MYIPNDDKKNYLFCRLYVCSDLLLMLLELCLKWTYGHSGNDYRVATLSKFYLTTTGITMQKFEIDRTILTCLD